MEVETSAGVWRVRRRWAPRQLGSQTIGDRFLHRSRSVRRRTTELGDLPDPGCGADVFEGIVVFIVLVIAVLFLVFIGIPLLIALGELVFLVLVAPAGLVGRVLFRRPWTVDAVSPTGVHFAWAVIGWKARGAARQFVADRIAATSKAPADEEVSAAILSP